MTVLNQPTCFFAALLLALPAGAAEPPATAALQAVSPAAGSPQTVSPLASTTAPATAQQQDSGAAYQRPVFAAEPDISDPTRISETFREALERRMPSKSAPAAAGTQGAAAPAAVKMPEIALAASVCGHHQDMMHAMLRINGKVELVRPGDRLTLIEPSGVTEIRVLDIQRDHVHVRVLAGMRDAELFLH